MRRAIITLVTAMTLTISGLTLGPGLKAAALGETSVTLNCSDGTGFTLSVDTTELAQLTAAVQGMIDYPAGLSCTLVQNPLPGIVSFGHLALAATSNEFIVDGGRWLLACAIILGGGNPISVPTWLAARASKGPGFASRTVMSPPSTACDDPLGCVWVNIGVNLHHTGSGTLEGTLNETIPEHQSCPDLNNGGTFAVGPSHFTSKPTPPNTSLVGCLTVNSASHQAATITYVTEISGLEASPGVAQGFFVGVGSEVDASFFDSQTSPSQPTDMLNAPPVFDDSSCRTGVIGAQFNFQQNGNINVHP